MNAQSGRLFLQIPGPANIPHRVLQAMESPLLNHRGAEFAEICKALLPKLKAVFQTERGTPVIFPSSGSGAMESALVNTLSPGDGVLVFAIGNFSAMFGEISDHLGFSTKVVELPLGGGIPPERVFEELKADRAGKFKAIVAIHNETATGVTTDISAIRQAIDRAGHSGLFLVDTISGLGCMDFRFDEWGVDVAITGSQKGLLLPPGLGLVCLNEKALQAYRTASSPRHYFDWGAIIEYNRRGIFPYTPATQLLFGLDTALDMLLEEGLEKIFARHARAAEGVRRAVTAWGLKTVALTREVASNSLTAVRVPTKIDSDALIAYTEKHLNLALGNGLGELSGKAFRIGHLGVINDLEILATLGGVEMGLHRMGASLQLGSGVAACQEWFLGE